MGKTKNLRSRCSRESVKSGPRALSQLAAAMSNSHVAY
jgi:hypothetical protein